MVTRWRATRSHSRAVSGTSGEPSYNTRVAPLACVPKAASGPITQPMSVIQQNESPSEMSNEYATSVATLIVKPACV